MKTFEFPHRVFFLLACMSNIVQLLKYNYLINHYLRCFPGQANVSAGKTHCCHGRKGESGATWTSKIWM